MKEKLEARQSEVKETVLETVKDQEVTTPEVVSNDAEASEEVFEEDLVTDELNPRTRLRLRSRRLVLSVGAGEAVARPSNPNRTIDQLDGVTEREKDDAIDEVKKKDDELFITFDLTIRAFTFLDAFGSIEENLNLDEYGPKIPFIGEVPSRAIKDEKSEENTLYTLEIKVVNDETFLEILETKFLNWDPLWHGKPRGALLKFVKRL